MAEIWYDFIQFRSTVGVRFDPGSHTGLINNPWQLLETNVLKPKNFCFFKTSSAKVDKFRGSFIYW